MKFYLDTSIWLDIIEKRGYHGEIAKQLIEAIILEDATIVYSDIVINELKSLGYKKEHKRFLHLPKQHKIIRVITTKKQILEARKISKKRNIPLRDVLHAILARDHEAELISGDAHFLRLYDITKTKNPEDVL